MLYFSRWKALGTLLTAFIVCLFAVPNFFSDATLKRWPAWAQRHVVLGLDLQGGSHILLEVDANYVRKEKAEQLRDDVRRVLREARVGYTGLVVRGLTVEVRIREESDFNAALAQAARTVPAARRIAQRDRAALARHGRRRKPGDPAHHYASRRSPSASASRSSSRSRSSNAASTSSARSSR